MVSLAVLLSVIVAGMNIINYNKVVSDADTRLDVLEENFGGLLMNSGKRGGQFSDPGLLIDWEDFYDDFFDDDLDNPGGHAAGRGRGRDPFMTRDEAEESSAISQELSEQSVSLNDLVAQFSIAEGDED